MSLHIRDCIQDYGPTYAFWCFSFERYNGYLGKYQTNNHGIAVTIMKKLISDKASMRDLPEELQMKATEDSCNPKDMRKLWSLRYKKEVTGLDLEFSCERPLSVFRLSTLTVDEENQVRDLFFQLYGTEVRISTLAKECKRLSLGNEMVACKTPRLNSYSLVLARYPDFSDPQISLRPAMVIGLHQVSVMHQDGTKASHFIGKVKWLKPNTNKHFFGQNANLDIWCTDFDAHAKPFIPAKYISNRVTLIKIDLDLTKGGRLPLVDRVYIMVKLPTKSIL